MKIILEQPPQVQHQIIQALQMITAQMQTQNQQVELMSKVEHVFEWKQGGNEVLLMGAFNKWIGEKLNPVQPEDLRKKVGFTQQNLSFMVSGETQPTHCLIKQLDPGKYEYKFCVDEQW